MVPVLLTVALDCLRDPLGYRHLRDPQLPLPSGFDGLLLDLCSAVAPARAAETAALVGAREMELQTAARFLVRHMLLATGTDYYRQLGLRPGASPAAIRRHYRLLMGLFHPDRGSGLNAADATVAVRLNSAYQTLRNDVERRRYDAKLAAAPQPTDPAVVFRRRPGPGDLSFSEPERARAGLFTRGARQLFWLSTAAAVMGGLLFLTFGSDSPELRRRDQGDVTPPAPDYLREAAQRLIVAPAKD